MSWIQDFYLELVEDGRKITPREYLEIALRPFQGKRDVAAQNEVVYLLVVKMSLHYHEFISSCLALAL